jgi:hypothetical protein
LVVRELILSVEFSRDLLIFLKDLLRRKSEG